MERITDQDKLTTLLEPAQLIIIGAIVAIFVISFRGKGETTLYCVVIAMATCVVTALSYGTGFIATFETIFSIVNVKPLIVLLCFGIIINVVEQQTIFEYFAIRIIRMTKDNVRLLFYLICLLAAFFSCFLEDVSVAMIFIPLIIRTAQLLVIDAVPFITGIAYSIIAGNLLTAFASPSNILIAELLNVDTTWFFTTFFWLFILIIGVSLVLLDLRQVRRLTVPDPTRVTVLIEIFDSKTLIASPRKFAINLAFLIGTFVAVILIPTHVAPLYLVLIIAVLVICGSQSESIGKHLKKADWNLVLFILSIFLISACLSVSGLLAELTLLFSNALGDNVILSVIVITITCSLIGSFFSKSAAIIIFSTIVTQLPIYAAYKDVLVMAVVIGTIIAGNIVPQSASHLLKTLSITRERHVDKVSQKMLIKNSVAFTMISLVTGILYTLTFLLF